MNIKFKTELCPSQSASQHLHIVTAFHGIMDRKSCGLDQEWTVYIFDCLLGLDWDVLHYFFFWNNCFLNCFCEFLNPLKSCSLYPGRQELGCTRWFSWWCDSALLKGNVGTICKLVFKKWGEKIPKIRNVALRWH